MTTSTEHIARSDGLRLRIMQELEKSPEGLTCRELQALTNTDFFTAVAEELRLLMKWGKIEQDGTRLNPGAESPSAVWVRKNRKRDW